VLTAVEKKEITAPITDYISHDDYIAGNGYQTLKGVLDGSIEAESIIKKMEDSGLRGLGGAGFPAGRKWRIVSSFDGPRLMGA
jgi:formate dehydrogenase